MAEERRELMQQAMNEMLEGHAEDVTAISEEDELTDEEVMATSFSFSMRVAAGAAYAMSLSEESFISLARSAFRAGREDLKGIEVMSKNIPDHF